MNMRTIIVVIIFIVIIFLLFGVLYLRKLTKESPSIIHPGEELAPIGVPILYTEGERILFIDFTLKYLGTVDVTPERKTSYLHEDNFSVIDFQGNEQIITVRWGQIPPKPLQFFVNNISYTLWTYLDSKGNRLEKKQLIITKN